MSESYLLFLVLAAIYLTECVVWVRADCLALRRGGGRFRPSQWRILDGGALPGNQWGGFLLCDPLPPLGRVTTCQQWPLSISPSGAYSYVAAAFNPGTRPAQAAKHVRFDEMAEIAASERSILVNEALFVKTGSARLARSLAALLQSLRALPESRREEAIQAAIDDSLDVERIAGLFQQLDARTAALRTCCSALFVHLFVVTPVLIWMGGIVATWPLIVLILLALLLAIALLYRRAHRSLFPGESAERGARLFTMLLAPPTAIRALDALTRDLLAGCHPLAAARVLCDETRFGDFARRVVLDQRFPIRPVCPTRQPEVCATEQWYRSKLSESLERFLASSGIDPDELAQPPSPESASCRAYCPRCHDQYVTDSGECAACGLALLPRQQEGAPSRQADARG